MKFKNLILIFSLVITSLAASAQGDTNNVTMLVDVVAWGDDIPGLHIGRLGDQDNQIKALSYRYNQQPVRYSGPELLAIYQTKSASEPEQLVFEDEMPVARPLIAENPLGGRVGGKVPPVLAERRLEEPNLVALVALPKNARRVTLLLAPAAEGTYAGLVFEDDPSKLPLGKLRVHNFTSYPTALQFKHGDAVSVLQSRESILVEPTGENHAVYRLAYQVEGSWKSHGSSFIRLPPDQQTRMIILRSDNVHFQSSTGSTGGFFQIVTLRRRLE